MRLLPAALCVAVCLGTANQSAGVGNVTKKNFTVTYPLIADRARGYGFYGNYRREVNTTDEKMGKREHSAIQAELIKNGTVWNQPEIAFSNKERKKFKAYRLYLTQQKHRRLDQSRYSSLHIPALDGPFEPDQADLTPSEMQPRFVGPKTKFGDTYQQLYASSCPDQCSGHGKCEQGKCACDEGYDYYNCGMRKCVHGRWGLRKVTGLLCPSCQENNLRAGTCLCVAGWQGEFCDLAQCPRGTDIPPPPVPEGEEPEDNTADSLQCSGKGTCGNGTCKCKPGHEGKACEKATCSRHGDWNSKDQFCECYTGWSGDGCELKACPFGNNPSMPVVECSGNGQCEKSTGKCKCNEGFEGTTCCPLGCHKHGRCEEGKCLCDHRWAGPACLTRMMKSCSSQCTQHGVCEDGKCVCKKGYYGYDCQLRRCENDCNKNGVCDAYTGTCRCYPDWTGDDCSTRRCPMDCQPDKTAPPRGECVRGLCECDKGFIGLSCDSRTCLNDCSGRGSCADGECICDVGFAGKDCSINTVGTCLNNCTGHGICKFSQCECNFGHMGVDCSRVRCVGEPQRGIYNKTSNSCNCKLGYEGEFCELAYAVNGFD